MKQQELSMIDIMYSDTQISLKWSIIPEEEWDREIDGKVDGL